MDRVRCCWWHEFAAGLVGGLVGHYLKARQDQMGLDDANSRVEASRRFDQRDACIDLQVYETEDV
jgi:hypothetical protein